MKTIFKFTILLLVLLAAPQHTEAQFFKKLQKHAEEKIKREAENRTERRVDKGIDKGFDKTEDAIDGKGKKKKKKSRKGKKDKNVQSTDGKYSKCLKKNWLEEKSISK